MTAVGVPTSTICFLYSQLSPCIETAGVMCGVSFLDFQDESHFGEAPMGVGEFMEYI